MLTVLLVIDVLVCAGLIGLILIQHGKGADVGAAFGSGASQTVFGSQGSGSFLTRSTAVLAVLFFIISLSLSYLYGQTPQSRSVVDSMAPKQESAPPQDTGTGLPPRPASDVPNGSAPAGQGAAKDTVNIPELNPSAKPNNAPAPVSGSGNAPANTQQKPADVPAP